MNETKETHEAQEIRLPQAEADMRETAALATGWKRVGWLALGVTPLAAVLWWQTLASLLFVIVYAAVTAGTGAQTQGDLLTDMTAGSAYGQLMFIIYVGYLILFGLWYGLMFVRREKSGNWKQALRPRRIIGIIGCGVAAQLALAMLLSLILPLFPKLLESYMGLMETLGSDSLLMILCVCLLAPVGEELIFRGLTLRILKKAIPWQAAIVVQAVFFGIYHLNLVQGVYATLIGLLLGYVAQRYGSVLPGILLHMAINGSSYLVSALLPASLEEQPIMETLLAAAGAAAMLGFLYLALPKKLHPAKE